MKHLLACLCLLLAACSDVVASPAPDGGDASTPIADAMTSAPMIGVPGCGLPHAAFCDTFDAPSAHRGRAGDLDARMWSAGHVQPSLPTAPGFTFGILPATIPSCRGDLPAQVFPGNDALICDPVPSVASPHLLVACGAQNYGATSLRVRQPFDFAGRTGTIAFDADGFVINPLLGWIQVSVTEDPMAVPSYAILGNDEGGVVPRNGFEVHMARNCPDGMSMGPRMIALYDERVETILNPPEGAACIPVKEGHLNHFEVRVSQSRIEVYASPWSEDGTSFEPGQLLFAADVQLPFTRGYVTIAVHNHATIKYSEGDSPYSERFYDAWVARWDNVGFDGPVLASFREYEIPDASEMHEGTLNIGYLEYVTRNVPQSYPPAALNIDLVLSTQL
jgi:hypothetical protein